MESQVIILVQIVASLFSLVLFLAPLNDFGVSFPMFLSHFSSNGEDTSGFEKKSDFKSKQNINQIPFYCMLLSGLLWSTYGVLRNDAALLFVNATGVLLSFYYLSLCYKFIERSHNAPESDTIDHSQLEAKKRAFITKVSIPILIWLFSIAFCFLWNEGSEWLGRICLFATIVLFASPLIVLKNVLITRNGSLISSSLTLAQIANCSSWSLYGYLISDSYIWIPNCIGAILGCIAYLVKGYIENFEPKSFLP